MEEESRTSLPSKSQHEWYLIISKWTNDILLGNLTWAQKKEDGGRGDNWSAAVIQVAKEREII